MVFKGIDLEYCQQVTAEHKIMERSGNGAVKTRWVPKSSHADNHYLDCEVYAFAAADVLNVRALYLSSEDTSKNGRNLSDEQKLDAAPEQNLQESMPDLNNAKEWVNINEDWLNGGF